MQPTTLYLVFAYSPGRGMRALAHVLTGDVHRAAWFALVMIDRGCEIDIVSI